MLFELKNIQPKLPEHRGEISERRKEYVGALSYSETKLLKETLKTLIASEAA